MTVTITKDELEAHGACHAYLNSPEWTGDALVYSNWDETVQRLISTKAGIDFLGWLVAHNLVPTTRIQFRALKKSAQVVNG